MAEGAQAVDVVSKGPNAFGNAPCLCNASDYGGEEYDASLDISHDVSSAFRHRCHVRSGSFSEHEPLLGAGAEFHQSLDVVCRDVPREFPALWFQAVL